MNGKCLRKSQITFCIKSGFVTLFVLVFSLPVKAQSLQQLHGHLLPREVTSRLVSSVDDSQTMHFSIGLPLKHPEALDSLLKAIYDPKNPHYRHFLTPEQFGQMFGVSEADYQTLIDFARRHHLQITSSFKNHTLLELSGTASQIQEVFHVRLNNYLRPDGTVFYAPDAEPSVDINIPVQHITGLDNYDYRPLSDRNSQKPLSGPALPGPKSRFQNGKSAAGTGPNCFGTNSYTGSDLRTALFPCTTLNGTGETVALVEFDNYYDADISSYAIHCGQTVPSITRVPVDQGTVQTPSCGNFECSLDIEMVMALAPNASISVYEGPYNGSCFTNSPPLDVLAQIANDDKASVISSSWMWYGFADTNVTTIFQQFATQGETFFQCSGDYGAFYSGDPYSVPFQPSCESDLMTVVGATELTTTGTGASVGTYVSETTWNTSPGPAATKTPAVNAVSGGGFCDNASPLAIPTYQVPFVTGLNSASALYRNEPDVSMIGYNLSVVWNNGEYGCGEGTSASAPLWAAVMALVDQEAANAGQQPLGYINFALYSLALNPTSYANDFNDILDGSNNNYWGSNTSIYKAVAGYDLCTGLGSPKCSIINDLLQIVITPTATVTNTSTDTATKTATKTVTNTFTSTQTYTVTNTPTITDTLTITNTQTVTDTPTITNTPTVTDTSTQTYTPTNSTTITDTPTITNTRTITPTAVATVGTQVLAYPNPVMGQGPVYFHVPLNAAGNIKVEIFTLAFRSVREANFSQQPAGVDMSVNPIDNWGNALANGLYYVRITTAKGNTVLKLMILR